MIFFIVVVFFKSTLEICKHCIAGDFMFHELSFISKLCMMVHTYVYINVEKCVRKTG